MLDVTWLLADCSSPLCFGKSEPVPSSISRALVSLAQPLSVCPPLPLPALVTAAPVSPPVRSMISASTNDPGPTAPSPCAWLISLNVVSCSRESLPLSGPLCTHTTFPYPVSVEGPSVESMSCASEGAADCLLSIGGLLRERTRTPVGEAGERTWGAAGAKAVSGGPGPFAVLTDLGPRSLSAPCSGHPGTQGSGEGRPGAGARGPASLEAPGEIHLATAQQHDGEASVSPPGPRRWVTWSLLCVCDPGVTPGLLASPGSRIAWSGCGAAAPGVLAAPL